MKKVALAGDFTEERFIVPRRPNWRMRGTVDGAILTRLAGVSLTQELLMQAFPGSVSLVNDSKIGPVIPPAGAISHYCYSSQIYEIDVRSGLTTRVLHRSLQRCSEEMSLANQLSKISGEGASPEVVFIEQELFEDEQDAGNGRLLESEVKAILEIAAKPDIEGLLIKTNQPGELLAGLRDHRGAPKITVITTLRALEGNTFGGHTWDAVTRFVVERIGTLSQSVSVVVELWTEGCLLLRSKEGHLFWDAEVPLGAQRRRGGGWTPGSTNVTCAALLSDLSEGWPTADQVFASWVLSRLSTASGNLDERRELADLPAKTTRLLSQPVEQRPRADKYDRAEFSLPLGTNWQFASNLSVNTHLTKRVVHEGVDALRKLGTPFLSLGRLFEVDEAVIENILSLQRLLRDYASRRSTPHPLSVAVFGPPGSGKSFAVTELTKFAHLPLAPKFLSFNLSQFRSLDDLEPAFHQVQSSVLRGSLPVVFWDEFDSALNGVSLGFLKAFLGPMQDGEFVVRGASHPVGRAIFVFAGGTASSFKEFADRSDMQSRDAKLVDFVSRVKAWLDIKGLPAQDTAAGRINRAMMLHSMLKHHAPDVRTVDDDMINLVVDPETFVNARALERAIETSALDDTDRFTRARFLFPTDIGRHA